jgi:hypothetical protein
VDSFADGSTDGSGDDLDSADNLGSADGSADDFGSEASSEASDKDRGSYWSDSNY